MLSLMGIGICALGTRFAQTKRILGSNKWLVALFIYMALSITWSNFPAISFVRWVRIVGVLEMVVVVLTERYPFEAVRVFLRRLYLVHILLSATAIKYVRNIGVFYDWSGAGEDWIGLSTDKNSLGQVAMCSGIFWLWQICRDWRGPKQKGNVRILALDGALLIITLWILRGSKTSHSSTSIIGFIFCATILLALQLIKRRAAGAKRIIALVIIALLFVLPPIYLAFEAFGTTPLNTVVKATGRNMTFTDRNLIWADVLNDVKDPMLGVGIGAFWVGSTGYTMYPMPNWSRKTPEWRPQEAHNGYVDTYAQLGIVGLILLFIVIGHAFAGALSDLEGNFGAGTLRLALLLGILLSNLSESSFLLGTHDLWLLFLLVCANVPAKSRSVHLNRTSQLRTTASGSIETGAQAGPHRVALASPIDVICRRIQLELPG